jgi:hypothetical protein
MTDEEQWLAYDEPKAMAHQLSYDSGNRLSGLLSPRKRRLIGCACCRVVWGLLPEEHQRAVEVSEWYAEGWTDEAGLRQAYAATAGCATAASGDANGVLYWSVAQVVARINESHRQRLKIPLPDRRVDPNQTAELERLAAEDGRRLCEVIRDVAGNPFRPVVPEPAWLDANNGQVRAVAASIDAEGHFDELPILADALEDAGCSDERILTHARQPRHFRGCWLIDAVLGKS